MLKNLLIATSIGLVGATTPGYGAPTLYGFSGIGTMGQFFDLVGSSISGTFMYDPAAMQTGTTPGTNNPANAALFGGHLLPSGPYSSYTALNAMVTSGGLISTLAFSDPRGTTIVSNDGFRDTATGHIVDFLALDADPFGPGGIHNIVPFTLGDQRLWNVRIFWIEEQVNAGVTVPDILSSQNLPSILPSVPGRLALDFVPVGSTTGAPLSFAFFSVTVAPLNALLEPPSYALLLAGLVFLGIMLSTRKPARG